jgi:hypothetical protein
MKNKLLLCLALVLSGGLFGCSTAKSQNAADEKTWQTTLRAAVTNSPFPPFSISSIGTTIYVVPADAAKILESQPPSELMPFLIKLRASQSSSEAGTVDEWSIIVRYGLRGTPNIITNALTSAKGAAISTTEISVYNYTDNYLQRTHNFTKQLSDILTECQNIKPGMTRAELLKVFGTQGGISTDTQRTFVYRGCPYIKVDVDSTLSAPKQNALEERPTDTISKISKPYLDWSIGD